MAGFNGMGGGHDKDGPGSHMLSPSASDRRSKSAIRPRTAMPVIPVDGLFLLVQIDRKPPSSGRHHIDVGNMPWIPDILTWHRSPEECVLNASERSRSDKPA